MFPVPHSFSNGTTTTFSAPPTQTQIQVPQNPNSQFSPLYCKGRNGKIIELNSETLQLNQISPQGSSSPLSPSKYLHVLRSWPSGSNPKRMLSNELGNLVAIQGTKGNVTVVRISVDSVVIEEIEIIGIPADLINITWHPASPADHHLIALTKSGKIFIFDLLQAKAEYFESDDEEGKPQEQGESGKCRLMNLAEFEQEIKIPSSRTDSFSAITFISGDSWLKFTAFLIKESGDIYALCPLLPTKFRAQRQGHLIPLKSQSQADSISLKWLDEVLLSGEFVANSAGDVDWILATCPSSFSHLQPKLQGPFLIQPEPMEIHQLSSYDCVVDFSAFHLSTENVPMLSIAFGSGKVDLLAICSEIYPKFQLKGTLVKSKDDSDLLPTLALIESIDLKGSNEKSSNDSASRRSVNNQIKFLEIFQGSERGSMNIFVSINESVIKITLKIREDADFDSVNDSDWSIECHSGILIDKLKSHVQCISKDGTIYPGAIKLDVTRDIIKGTSIIDDVNVSGLLENVTKYAFPLGRMEIESGAIQLEGLIENLQKTLGRLKSQTRTSTPVKLPQNVNEICATEFNDHVSEWQETLVSPAMRVGHEIALRSTELVQILRREREILVRAKTLLTAKPERLERLLSKLSQAKEANKRLTERVQILSKELCKYSQYDQLLTVNLQEISAKLRQHPLITTSENVNENGFVVLDGEGVEEDLVKSQLLIQSEKLMKLKNQLKSFSK